MKKFLFILATAAIVASCAENDSFKEINTQGTGNEAISFTSYTSKATRAENSGAAYSWSFYTHQPDFIVYAYKNPNNAYSDQVFSGQIIDANSDGSFAYHTATEARYWDKSATTQYQFYAAAPSGNNGNWEFKTTNIDSYANQDKGYFTTSSTLSGVNLRSATTDNSKITSLAEATSTFKETADVDKLIASPCSGNYPSFVDPSDASKHVVQFHFNHILSKLNVTVKKDATTFGTKEVKLESITFYNIKNSGDFSEATAAVTTGSHGRWSNQARAQVSNADVVYTFSNADGVALDGTTPIYFIESLIIPQPIQAQTVDYDGTIPAVLYADLTDYKTDHPDYSGEWDDLTADQKVKTAASSVINNANAEPYFKISYTIAGELFTSYHNLATAFKTTSESTLNFYEGFQNTLNITIKPEKIDFTADVAAWDNGSVAPASADVD